MFAFAKNLVKSTIETRGSIAGGSQTPSYGFRVIHVDQNSPATEAGVESLFDFVVGINGHKLIGSIREGNEETETDALSVEDPPIDWFMSELARCAGTSISLSVWTAKGRIIREVILPVLSSSSEKPNENDYGLGLSLQWTPLSVADHVWHVLNVSPNSPAQRAGLISHSDYIVGAENGLLVGGGEGLLARIVSRMVSSYYEQQEDENLPADQRPTDPPSIELYVYNHDYDTLRPVRIHPNPDWGGSGLLGCGVGYGLLHRLPVVISNRRTSSHQRTTSFAPGDTLFEASAPIPASTLASSIPTSAPPTGPVSSAETLVNAVPARKKAHHHHASATQNADLSAYFEEEQKRSRDNEVVKTKLDASVPPPPKSH